MGEVEPDGLSESRKREFKRIEDAGKLLISQGLDSSESLRPMLYEIVELLDDIAAGERSSQGTAPNTKFVPYTTMLFVCGVQSRYIMCSVMGSVVAYVFGRCAQSVCHYARLTAAMSVHKRDATVQSNGLFAVGRICEAARLAPVVEPGPMPQKHSFRGKGGDGGRGSGGRGGHTVADRPGKGSIGRDQKLEKVVQTVIESQVLTTLKYGLQFHLEDVHFMNNASRCLLSLMPSALPPAPPRALAKSVAAGAFGFGVRLAAVREGVMEALLDALMYHTKEKHSTWAENEVLDQVDRGQSPRTTSAIGRPSQRECAYTEATEATEAPEDMTQAGTEWHQRLEEQRRQDAQYHLGTWREEEEVGCSHRQRDHDAERHLIGQSGQAHEYAGLSQQRDPEVVRLLTQACGRILEGLAAPRDVSEETATRAWHWLRTLQEGVTAEESQPITRWSPTPFALPRLFPNPKRLETA